VRDAEWNEPVFPASTMLVRGGVKIAVLGQAYPYTPIANPRWMIPNWSFGIREGEVRAEVEKARAAGAELVVLLSHNGFDVDRKLAGRVAGIDVVLTAHTHDALPAVVKVGRTLLIASGTATLEAALLGTPMVLCYRVSRTTEVIARLLTRVAWIGLPNLVSGRLVVPELIQAQVTGERLAAEATRLLDDPVAATAQRAALKELRARLGEPGVGRRAARAVLATARAGTQPATQRG